MFENLEKAVYAGIGLAFMTKEKAEDVTRKFTSEAKMGEAEGKKFFDTIMARSNEARAQMEQMIRENVENTFDKLNVPSAQKVREMESRVARLEAKVFGVDEEK